MKKVQTTSRLVWLWGVIPLVAAIEIFVQWRIPKQEPSEEDWKKAAQAISAEKQSRDLVVVAPDWAVQGRMHLKKLISLKDFGRIDTTTYERIYEVSIAGVRAPETDGLTPEDVSAFGKLTVSRYKLPPPVQVLYDFVARLGSGKVDGFRLKRPRLVIDHWFFPRFVVTVPLSRKRMSLTFENVPLDGTLRIHGIIGYREGRFNKGGPVTMSVFVDGERIGMGEVKNFGPREPYDFPIRKQGTGTVRFDFQARDNFKREFGFAADIRREQGGGR